MGEPIKIQGYIKLWRRDLRGFQLDNGKWYSQFKSFNMDDKVRLKGQKIEFNYNIDGIFNNIQEGSIQILQGQPRVMTEEEFKNNRQGFSSPLSPVDKDTLIVRQSCLKAAVEFMEDHRSAEQFDVATVMEIAEQFEEWVFR